MSDEIDFLHADKHVSLLQIDMTLIGIVKHSRNSTVTMSLQYIKKEVRKGVFIFSLQLNTKVSFRLIPTLWASKIPTTWYYHYCWVWSSILKVLKVISLQYLYKISKKEFRKGVHFSHADEHQSFYKLGLFFFMEVARYVQSTQNSELVIFFAAAFVFHCDVKHSDILQRSSHVYCYLFPRTTRLEPDFLPEHLNIIIKKHLLGEVFPSLLPLLQAEVFQ